MFCLCTHKCSLLHRLQCAHSSRQTRRNEHNKVGVRECCLCCQRQIFRMYQKVPVWPGSPIPFNFTLFVISLKLQRIWSWKFGFGIRKICAFIWYQKIHYFQLSPGGWDYNDIIHSHCFLEDNVPLVPVYKQTQESVTLYCPARLKES